MNEGDCIVFTTSGPEKSSSPTNYNVTMTFTPKDGETARTSFEG